jgi:hypothetical protein
MAGLPIFVEVLELSLTQSRRAFAANQGGVSWLEDLLVLCTEAK